MIEKFKSFATYFRFDFFLNVIVKQKRWVYFNDPAWESSGWGGVVGWVTYQLPISSSPVAGSKRRRKNLPV